MSLATAIILTWTSLGMLGKRTVWNILWVLVSVISGSLIFASVHIVANAMAFFTVESSGFSWLAWTVDEFTRYPADIYDRVTRTVITWILPVAFASFYPAQLFFENGYLETDGLGYPRCGCAYFHGGLPVLEYSSQSLSRSRALTCGPGSLKSMHIFT